MYDTFPSCYLFFGVFNFQKNLKYTMCTVDVTPHNSPAPKASGNAAGNCKPAVLAMTAETAPAIELVPSKPLDFETLPCLNHLELIHPSTEKFCSKLFLCGTPYDSSSIEIYDSSPNWPSILHQWLLEGCSRDKEFRYACISRVQQHSTTSLLYRQVG